jgi:hypothetical protein
MLVLKHGYLLIERLHALSTTTCRSSLLPSRQESYIASQFTNFDSDLFLPTQCRSSKYPELRAGQLCILPSAESNVVAFARRFLPLTMN